MPADQERIERTAGGLVTLGIMIAFLGLILAGVGSSASDGSDVSTQATLFASIFGTYAIASAVLFAAGGVVRALGTFAAGAPTTPR